MPSPLSKPDGSAIASVHGDANEAARSVPGWTTSGRMMAVTVMIAATDKIDAAADHDQRLSGRRDQADDRGELDQIAQMAEGAEAAAAGNSRRSRPAATTQRK